MASKEHFCLVDRLEEWQAASVLATPGQREAFFRGLDYEQFKKWLVSLNGVILADNNPGFLPPNMMNVQYQSDDEQCSPLEYDVLYRSVTDATHEPLLSEAFRAAQAMPDVDTAITLLGIITTANHRLYDGHTRTTVAGRQLLSSDGRGYRGGEEDGSYYVNLVTDRSVYMAQNLHPLRAGLVRSYTHFYTTQVLPDMGYEGPVLAGTDTKLLYPVYKQLPRWWHPIVRDEVAKIMAENDFSVVSLTAYLYSQNQGIGDYTVQQNGETRLSIEKIARAMSEEDETDVYGALFDAYEVQKSQFVQRITDCIAYDDDCVFGTKRTILNAYRLPGAD